jgi:hypothetical protein
MGGGPGARARKQQGRRNDPTAPSRLGSASRAANPGSSHHYQARLQWERLASLLVPQPNQPPSITRPCQRHPRCHDLQHSAPERATARPNNAAPRAVNGRPKISVAGSMIWNAPQPEAHSGHDGGCYGDGDGDPASMLGGVVMWRSDQSAT